MTTWPGGSRGALCLSFDNLGEAAEIELGTLAPDDPTVGTHPTATRVLPGLLATLAERDLSATFFVEGLNTELYPEALREIAARGHEVAYHAWRHERWGDLGADEQAANLARGAAAFGAIGLDLAGLRPPGGQLGAGGVQAPHEAGLRYCSPAGEGAGIEGGVALLPFQWQHVDAACVLPSLAPVRGRIAGSPDPLDPDAFRAHLEAELDRLAGKGGFATFVLHLFMLDWLGERRLADLLESIVDAGRSGAIWMARCDEVAAHLLSDPGNVGGEATLDPTTWAE